MQVEILKTHPPTELEPYLRVATIASKTALRYFYIGDEKDSVQFLSDTFNAGIRANDFEVAKNILSSGKEKDIDVIIIDLPYNEMELKEFHFFLRNRNFGLVPLIYNSLHLKNEFTFYQNDMLDDIIDLSGCQYDLSGKISFLKKLKTYNASTSFASLNVNPDISITKRIFDVLIASVLLLLLLPLFIIIAIAIKLESRGPVFYNANRAGRGFRIFKFYKFRTMEVNADKKINVLSHLNQYKGIRSGAKFFKISNDPRITKVGRFLRNTSLDELPQLINVLKGDMSLVGNRPLPLYEAATLTTNDFVERFMAPAGITGLWQIKRRGQSDMSTEERINLDISYAKKSSLLYDFWIMLNTPRALVQKSDV